MCVREREREREREGHRRGGGREGGREGERERESQMQTYTGWSEVLQWNALILIMNKLHQMLCMGKPQADSTCDAVCVWLLQTVPGVAAELCS